jgi:hypothetical protein
VIDVGSGGQAVHIVHDQIEIVQVCACGIEKVGEKATRGAIAVK